jgi:glycosyltransferase involved in cell wall biosynthesis
LVEAGFPDQKVHVLHYGVDVTEWRWRHRRFGLFCGRLSPEKGIATLLQAAARTPDVPVVIAGDGPMADAVGRHGNISYVGHLSGGAVAKLRQEAAFTVVPSEWEDVFPMTALESLAAGTPVIASRVGGLVEMISRPGAGLLVPQRQPDVLSAAMRVLWTAAQSDPCYGQAAAAYARERFSQAVFAKNVVSLYDRILGETREWRR